jgi:uncharacterized membrane protein
MIKLYKIKNVALRRFGVIFILPIIFAIYLIGAALLIVSGAILCLAFVIWATFNFIIQSPRACWSFFKTDIIAYSSIWMGVINDSKKLMKSDFKPCNKTDE